MKKPEPAPTGPPSAQSAVALMTPANASAVRELVERADRDYLYWSDFKYLRMPEAVSPEDAWRYLKSVRSIGMRSTQIRDVHGDRFTYTLTNEVQRCLHVIDRDAAGAVGATSRIPKHGEQRYLISTLMEEAIASSQIEGASTTRRVAKDMLRTGRRPKDRSERMIFNNYQTITAVRNMASEPITVELLIRLQAMLTQDALDDPKDVGRLRSADDEIVVHDAATLSIVHVPPHAKQLEAELKRLCDYANEAAGPFEHPVIKAVALHFWLAYLHPFVDGNGRTARALFQLYMLKSGYWLFEYLSISRIMRRRRGQYDTAFIHSEVDACDMTYFLTFHLHAIETALQNLWKYLADRAEEDRAMSQRLARDHSLNHRQRALLGRAVEDQNVVFTIESHRVSHNVTYPTARSDLLELARRGYLSQVKEGRAFVFVPAPDLSERLSGQDDL